MTSKELTTWLDQVLRVLYFKDCCPNGLQVEGVKEIKYIATGVTASEAFLESAINSGVDTVLVHHGLIWNNDDHLIRGIYRRRLKRVLNSNINVFAYHLPLDVHPEWGNNAQLARVLGFEPDRDFDYLPVTLGEKKLVWVGNAPYSMTLELFAKNIEHKLGRVPLVLGNVEKIINRVAWCTGSGQQMFLDAIESGVDVFITGEVSEYVTHMVEETGVAFISAGHHATERYGIEKLGQIIAERFSVQVNFFDINNPV